LRVDSVTKDVTSGGTDSMFVQPLHRTELYVVQQVSNDDEKLKHHQFGRRLVMSCSLSARYDGAGSFRVEIGKQVQSV